ncbi:alpha/beta hydrolase [Curtobacterium pusillum]|uniref:alpha/beta hydrolase n=1 Tax=Curtobacterium pusillum TaxID=69373 RepID=UPI0011A4A621|nr:hypothetical protein [Curtobacterium pusillum]
MSRSIHTTTTHDGTTVARVRAAGPGQRTWLLLHGSDGHETDLVPLAERLIPDAAVVAPRGTVPTPSGFAHVDRREDRTFDEDGLRVRSAALAALIEEEQGSVPPGDGMLLVGFSNGAVMAAALVESRPDLFSAAVLLRTQPPYETTAARPAEASAPAPSIPVLVLDGRDDARRRPDDGRRVADRLRGLGHRVSHVVLPTGHGITDDDERAIGAWLAGIEDGTVSASA